MHELLDIPTQRNGSPPGRQETVADLVARSKRGEVEAFTRLYRQFVDRVYGYAFQRLGRAHSAEEVTQEVFYRAFRGIAGCRDDEAFAGWLFGIARFVILDIHRARHRDMEPLEIAHDATDPDLLPDEQLLQKERGDELRTVRERCLSARDRELLDLLLADLTDREIAMALGRRYGAVRTAHWRLVNRLRDCFHNLDQEHEKGGRHVAS